MLETNTTGNIEYKEMRSTRNCQFLLSLPKNKKNYACFVKL